MPPNHLSKVHPVHRVSRNGRVRAAGKGDRTHTCPGAPSVSGRTKAKEEGLPFGLGSAGLP